MMDAEQNPKPQPPPPKTGAPLVVSKLWRRRRGLSTEELQDRQIRKWAELWGTIVLTLATLATAWAGYQAGLWNSLQTALNVQATTLRIESSQLLARGQQVQLTDITMFSNWANAIGDGNTRLAAFYRQRFRDEFQPVFEDWLATRPLENPDAPPSPFAMAGYRVVELEEADRLLEEAGRLTSSAEIAGTFGDQFTLTVVILAGALLLAGIASQFEWEELRAVVVGTALLILLASTLNLLALPAA
jgi:hypothetical protein